ncbi:hypothetical protein ACQ4PT_063650 [Festuca glaucescens]
MAATETLVFPGPDGYDCARRFRHKMLLSYLSRQRLFPTFQSRTRTCAGIICCGMVYRGQWADALDYLGRFNSRNTVASNALHFFLHTLWALANVATGATDGSVKSTAQHGMTLSTVICRCAKLRSIVKAMVDSPQQCASLDWESTRVMAASLAYYLADEDPELYRLMQLPDHRQMLPLLPIRPRRHVKRPPRRRTPGRGPAIARLYLSKRRSLQSSSPHTSAFMDESLDRVAGLVGKLLKLNIACFILPVPRFLIPLQIAPGAPVSQTNSGTTSVPNAGAPTSSQIMSGASTSLAKNSGMSSEQNSGIFECTIWLEKADARRPKPRSKWQSGGRPKSKLKNRSNRGRDRGRAQQNLSPFLPRLAMLPSHLNGHSPLARRPRLSAATGDTPAAEAAAGDAALEAHDRVYFQSYSHIGIHEAMIKDRVRTDAYRAAIMHHQKFIEGKVVMDVGCGTGILSVFCARAGAKRVYAVDASEIATQASEIVKANNLADKIVVIHGRVEDVEVEENVDIIISEWMGYMLLYESMLPSVLFARDKWLKPGGLILLSHATLFMAPITNSDRYEGSVDFWCDVYGINSFRRCRFTKQLAEKVNRRPKIWHGSENLASIRTYAHALGQRQ